MLRIEHSAEDSTGVPTSEVTNLDPTVPPFLPKHEKVNVSAEVHPVPTTGFKTVPELLKEIAEEDKYVSKLDPRLTSETVRKKNIQRWVERDKRYSNIPIPEGGGRTLLHSLHLKNFLPQVKTRRP